MRVIYLGGFTNDQLAEYRSIVYRNVLDSAQQVLICMKKIGLEYEKSNRVRPDLYSLMCRILMVAL